MARQLSRRQVLRRAGLAAVGIWTGAVRKGLASAASPNSKLNIAAIGCGGRGAQNLAAVAPLANITALCDVDDLRAGKTYEQFSAVQRFRDFRQMFDRMHRQIDGVIVSTPDHTHAAASLSAMKLGKHVYCEKPLTWSIDEARRMRAAAASSGLATQMGNQGTARDEFLRGVEVLRSGVLGQVHEVHVWTNRPGHWWKQGLQRPQDRPPLPSTLDWDLWLGPAPYRPYHPVYVPHDWRGWVDFGNGPLGDMGCHTLNQVFWGLELDSPIAVQAETSAFNGDSYPCWSIIRWEFPSRGKWPAMTMTWYDGWETGGRRPPAEWLDGEPLPGSGVLVIGDEGKFFSPVDFGEKWVLLPRDRFRNFAPPDPTLPRSPGHHQQWLDACRGGPAPLSNFDRASRLTEIVLLGVVAMRAGTRIQWDATGMRIKNRLNADRYLRRQPRAGWES